MRCMRLFLWIAVLLAASSSGALAQPLEAFVQEPHMRLAELSPDGRHLAFTTETDGRLTLVVHDLVDQQGQSVDVSEVRPIDLRWADDRMLLLMASDVTAYLGLRGTLDFSAIVAIDTEDGLSSRQLLRNVRRAAINFSGGRVVGLDADEGRVFVPLLDQNFDINLMSVDPRSGSSRIAFRGSRWTRDWQVGANGEVLARIDYASEVQRETIRVPDGSGWRIISEQTGVERPSVGLAGEMPDGRFAVTTTFTNESGRRGLYAFSLETGEITGAIFEHPEFDITGVISDPYTQQVLGVSWDEALPRVEWFDPRFAEIQAILDQAAAGQNPAIVSWSRDLSRILFVTQSEAQAPVYYLFDTVTPAIHQLAETHAGLPAGSLRPRQHITYPARDGTRIEAYLTVPEGEGPFPTVLLSHGGPATRDTGGFDPLAHFLASRGYAVIQPNFRGSGGYGDAWEFAGHGEWGTGVMQHDLSDAVAALTTAGIADPARVCIVGGSYGGYAALAGAVFTPDLYRCAVAIAGVSDVEELIELVENRYGRRHWLGAGSADRFTGEGDQSLADAMRAISPANFAENAQAPILLIHGRDDSVVPFSQSQIMQRALRREHKDVELVAVDNGDHWLTSTQMRREVYGALETFLAEHIGEQP